LIGSVGAMLLEKTTKTYHLCITLDEVWAEQKLPEFLMNVPLEAGEGIPFSLALPRLMRLYEELNFADSSMMWEFWQVFASYLMEHRLHLRVSRIEKRFGWPSWQLTRTKQTEYVMKSTPAGRTRLVLVALVFLFLGWISSDITRGDAISKNSERSLERIANVLEKLEQRVDLTKRYR
jgi:hypothetical protein